jgi:hypothetical protein
MRNVWRTLSVVILLSTALVVAASAQTFTHYRQLRGRLDKTGALPFGGTVSAYGHNVTMPSFSVGFRSCQRLFFCRENEDLNSLAGKDVLWRYHVRADSLVGHS